MTQCQHGDQRDDGDQVQNRSLIHYGVIVQTGNQQHQYESQPDPFQLVSMHACEMAGMSCGPDFQNAYAANGECGGQQPPVIVLDTTALLHWKFPGWAAV